LSQRRKESKGGEGRNATLALLQRGLLPERLQLHAFIATLSKDVAIVSPPLKIDETLEADTTSALLALPEREEERVLLQMLALYDAFHSCLQRKRDLGQLPTYPGRLSLINIFNSPTLRGCSRPTVQRKSLT
jgi:hypothetical protein